MKKGMIVGLAILLLLIAGGALYYMRKHAANSAVTQQPVAQTNMFTSIQDAMARSLTLQCDFTDAKNVHTVAYLKNGQIRADVTNPTDTQGSGSILIKDKTIYFWNAQKTGFTMAMPTVTGTPAALPTGSTENQGTDTGANMMANLEAYKKDCRVTSVADGLFVLPTDVKFTDVTKMMPLVPTGAASGSTGGYAIPTQYQQYIQR